MKDFLMQGSLTKWMTSKSVSGSVNERIYDNEILKKQIEKKLAGIYKSVSGLLL